jgi:hypothetical protein
MITDNNNEKLLVLGELFVDKAALHQAIQLMTSDQEENFGPRFHMFKQNNSILIDFFNNKKAHSPLTIEIESQKLAQLIDYWKILLEQRPEHIILTEQQDTYTLTEEAL